MCKEHFKKHKTAYLILLVVVLFAAAALLFSNASGIDLGSLLKGDIGSMVEKKAKMTLPAEKKATGATNTLPPAGSPAERQGETPPAKSGGQGGSTPTPGGGN